MFKRQTVLLLAGTLGLAACSGSKLNDAPVFTEDLTTVDGSKINVQYWYVYSPYDYSQKKKSDSESRLKYLREITRGHNSSISNNLNV